MGEPNDTQRFTVNFAWLLRLRWCAAAGQLATVAYVSLGIGATLPVGPLLALIALTAGSNLALEIWRRRLGGPAFSDPRRGQSLIAAIMIVDLMSLTGMLYFTGGLANPFVVFYFVNLALGGVVLPGGWSWTLCGLSVAGLGALALRHQELAVLDGAAENSTLHRQATLIALAGCAAVVTYFITRVTGALQRRERELRFAERRQERSQRLEALATLAAGAAHELASPLSTIAVVAKELTKNLDDADVSSTVTKDVQLIRSELDHCRSILNRMSGHAGQAVGEEVVSIRVDELIREVIAGLRNDGAQRVDVSLNEPECSLRLRAPLQALALAIRGVLQNALDADPHRVQLAAPSQAPGEIVLTIVDRGNGMSADVVRRAGEPFFTTKDPGMGMGLGLFLTRSVVERLGGALRLVSRPGQGTTAEITLPTEDG